jgi:hypothetical protein
VYLRGECPFHANTHEKKITFGSRLVVGAEPGRLLAEGRFQLALYSKGQRAWLCVWVSVCMHMCNACVNMRVRV